MFLRLREEPRRGLLDILRVQSQMSCRGRLKFLCLLGERRRGLQKGRKSSSCVPRSAGGQNVCPIIASRVTTHTVPSDPGPFPLPSYGPFALCAARPTEMLLQIVSSGAGLMPPGARPLAT